MGSSRGRTYWTCNVRRRESRARYETTHAAARSYARVRRADRARIAAKAAKITELEDHLASQVRD